LGQTLSCGPSDRFHLREIDIEPRSIFTEGASDDNFSPAFGELGEFLQIFGCELPCRHGIAVLEVREIRQDEFPSAYPTLIPLRRKGRPALCDRKLGKLGLTAKEKAVILFFLKDSGFANPPAGSRLPPRLFLQRIPPCSCNPLVANPPCEFKGKFVKLLGFDQLHCQFVGNVCRA
jgi:hypothetical protein